MTRRELLTAGTIAAVPGGGQARAQEALPASVMLTGSEQPEPRRITLAAGPLTLEFEPELAFIRYIRFGGTEVLRGIYAAVRDRAWRTVAPRVSNVKVNDRGTSFDLSFDVACAEGDIDFVWRGEVQGGSDGTIRYTMDGVARSNFLRNRIGFCVLHPMRECAGRPCTVKLTGGGAQEGRFPELISPHQPFKNMAAISHEVAPRLRAEVAFEGDVFEMEDHRNWTDGNFKTYCTPLERPYPVKVEKGTRIAQAITVRLLPGVKSIPAARPVRAAPLTLRATSESRKLPQIGFGVDPTGRELSRVETERLKRLRPAHLRVDLRLADSEWRSHLQRAWSEAAAVGARLECAAFVSDAAEAQLRSLHAEAQELEARVSRWLIFHVNERSTTGKWMQIARRALRPERGTLLASGTNHYFTELNRERPPVDVSDAVCYSINPQVHAFDNASLVENLEAQAHTVRTARSFIGERWLAVTPVTLKPRFNPNAPQSGAAPGELPDRIDVRQMSLFGAAWTLGSMKYLAESGADSVTFYDTAGWGGVMERSGGSSLPRQFRSLPGGVFPLYHVFADAADFAGGSAVRIVSPDPLIVDALLLELQGRRRLIVANMTRREQPVTQPPAFSGEYRMRSLDTDTFTSALTEPERWRDRGRTTRGQLRLAPYSVTMLDTLS